MRTSILFLLFTIPVMTADETRGWAVVYKSSELNPNIQTLMACSSNVWGCNNVYRDVENTQWFPTQELALDFVNGFWVGDQQSGGPLSKRYLNSDEPVSPNPMAQDKVIGVYRCERINLHLAKVGTHHAQVTETKDKEVDTMEWQP